MDKPMLLPAAERRGDIHFYLAKALPYRARLSLAFALMAGGLVIQAILIRSAFWIGVVPVLAGVLLLLTKGYRDNPVPKTGTEAWRPTDVKDIQRILEISKKHQQWDKDAVDIMCLRGCFVFVLLAIVVVWVAGVAAIAAKETAPLVLANGAVMLLPFWVTGVRSFLKADKLIVKINQLQTAEQAFKSMAPAEGEEFQYQMETAQVQGSTGQVPRDIKAIVLFHKAPAEFLGVQMQVSVNNVQGSDYPYFYCVLVARPGFGLLERRGNEAWPRKVIVEPKHQGDVDIIVIRQETTRNTGYYTKPDVVAQIATYAIAEARRMVVG